MDTSLISVLTSAAVPLTAAATSLYCHCSQRRLRSWERRSDAFTRGYQELDRELDRIWDLMDT